MNINSLEKNPNKGGKPAKVINAINKWNKKYLLKVINFKLDRVSIFLKLKLNNIKKIIIVLYIYIHILKKKIDKVDMIVKLVKFINSNYTWIEVFFKIENLKQLIPNLILII